MTESTATLHTDKGDITIRFLPDKAPEHVRNFIELSRGGFYDGVLFHRVIPGFMIQTGDPKTRDPKTPRETMGTGGSGKNLKAEFNDLSHRRGVVSMARAQHPDSASSQFFIVVKDSTFLDRQYTAFGQVTAGIEIADQIVSVPRDARDNPLEPVRIHRISIAES
jgi:peptidyl-prolyl cis-trans isomerase B (cyclophilin B)